MSPMAAACNITAFLILQIGTALAFKWGSGTPHLYWWGFLIGNGFGLLSTLAYIKVFQYLPAGVAVAACSGGAFVVVQIALAVTYRQPLNWVACVGALGIVAGIAAMALSGVPAE